MYVCISNCIGSENIFLDCVIMGLIIYGLVSSLVAQNCLKIIKENLRMFQNCWKKLRMFKNYYKIQMTRDDYKLQRIRALYRGLESQIKINIGNKIQNPNSSLNILNYSTYNK